MTSIFPTLRASIFATIAASALAFGPVSAADGAGENDATYAAVLAGLNN